jgi:hypothetical protein
LDDLRAKDDLKNLWTNEHDAIYLKLRQIMESDVVLSYPEFTEPFIIATDASSRGIGGVLYQVVNEETRYISFASRALSASERRYGATQRELLGVVFCLLKFQYYVSGVKFTLYTDHKALTYLFDQKKLKPFLLNWLDVLLAFDFDIVYRPGIKNVLPDKISRFYDEDPIVDEAEDVLWMVPEATLEQEDDVFLMDLDEVQPDVLKQPSSSQCNKDMERNVEVAIPEADHHVPAVASRDPLDVEVVVESQRQPLLSKYHLAGHFGSNQLVTKLLADGYYWPSVRKDAIELVKGCIPCQRFNIGKHGFHPLQTISASMPWDHIAIDLKSMEKSTAGNKFILVIVDVFTRFSFLRCLKNKKQGSIARELFKLFCDVGFQRVIQSDNGREFSITNHGFRRRLT